MDSAQPAAFFSAHIIPPSEERDSRALTVEGQQRRLLEEQRVFREVRLHCPSPIPNPACVDHHPSGELHFFGAMNSQDLVFRSVCAYSPCPIPRTLGGGLHIYVI